jgi:hypothetical protein
VVEAVPNAIVVSIRRPINLLNAQAEGIGYTREELLGRSIDILI